MASCADTFTKASLLTTVFALLCYSNVQGCYITDCPNSRWWNGKRGPEADQTRSEIGNPVRKCPPCGLRMTGQCFSARMCCTPALGCIVGENEITEPCRQESHIPLECASAGPACMRLDRQHAGGQVIGVCAADGLCCNADGCSFHHACQLSVKDPQSIIPTTDVVFQSLIGDLMSKAKPQSRRRAFPGASHMLQALRAYRRSQGSSDENRDDPVITQQDMY